MTLLLASSARRRTVTPARPYNSETYLDIPTPDETGKTTHPSVLDMVAEAGAPWNGYRYWMAHTPYANSNVQVENPCIAASNDKTTWVEPVGIVNPIDPWPGGSGYNSDTELVYEPDADELFCFWRDYHPGVGPAGNLDICYSKSSDGTTWTDQANVLNLNYSGGVEAVFSPAILKAGAGDYRMWLVSVSGWSQVRTATDLAGPWSAPTNLTFNGSIDGGVPGTSKLWHWGIRQYAGIFYGLVIADRSMDTAAIYAMTSTDGIAWSLNLDPILQGRDAWDRKMYRPTITFSGSRADVWYSAQSNPSGWRIGYTQIPLTEWPTPPV